MSTARKGLWIVLILALYLATSVPVGLFIYSLKSDAHIDIFSKTGFHSYLYCLKEQADLADGKEG